MDTDQKVVVIGGESDSTVREMAEVLQTVCQDTDIVRSPIYSELAGMVFPFRLYPELSPPPGYKPPKRSSVPLRKYPDPCIFKAAKKTRLSSKKAKHKAGFAGL